MKLPISVLAIFISVSSASAATPPQNEKSAPAPPSWAYPIAPPNEVVLKNDGAPHQVPGSSKSLTVPQILDSFNIPDWHPDGHPALPRVVEHGRKPGVRGCGYCHLPNGQGRPENASLAGLPAPYIEQQVRDIRSGARRSSEPRMGPPNNMIMIAEEASDDEVKSAAEYFSSLKLKPWIKVVEAATVLKTKVSGSMLVASDGGGTEPIGNRIIETPVNREQTELRDDASGFLAFVPPGSIKKGEALVTTGGAGKTTQCAICHGVDLRGLGPIPRLAGRSPSYLFRQLYDLQHGVRKGPWSDLMKAPVAHLSEEDMVSIAAYLASREP
ncbi:MAG: c-type cytochrome [Acidobacteriia bacterium]|nr:c-type cytochrome [Terriglobia bacterium]